MPSYVTPKKNTAYIFYASLVDQANTKLMKVNPTLAAGDFKVSIDGGALTNLATLPTVTPASSAMVKFSLSASEMNADNTAIVCIDAAGAEWCDLVVNIQTSARQVDDLAYPATSGRSMVVDAAGLVDANTVKLGPTGSGTAQTAKDVGGAVPAVAAGASGGILISGSNSGTTTLGALTITGATTHTGNMLLSAGLTVNQSTGNASAVAITGNGTGHGIITTSGSGATGDGLRATAASTNGHGITGIKTGTGSDLNATVTPLVLAKTTNLTGLNDIAATAVVSAGAITTSGGAVSTVTTLTTNNDKSGYSVTGLTPATVHSDLDDIQARLPAALVGGRIDASVGAIAANAITAASIAADAITDAKVAADVTIASVVGSVGSVVGISAANVTTALTEVTAILEDTGTTGVPISIGGIATTSFATGAIDSAAIATDAITSSELAQSAAQEIADEILNRDLAGGSSGNTRNVRNALRAIRNKVSEAAGTLTVTEEDDVTPAWTASVTRSAGTNPITTVDPT